MELKELFAMLDMESPKDFQYFEQFADLIESEEEIDFDMFYMVISEASPEDVGEIVENYFDEITNALPDQEEDIISLIDSISQNLMNLAESLDTSSGRRAFAEELYKFRVWYNDNRLASVDGEPCSVLEAVTSHREEVLGGDPREYDFSKAMDYELPDITMNLGKFDKIEL